MRVPIAMCCCCPKACQLHGFITLEARPCHAQCGTFQTRAFLNAGVWYCCAWHEQETSVCGNTLTLSRDSSSLPSCLYRPALNSYGLAQPEKCFGRIYHSEVINADMLSFFSRWFATSCSTMSGYMPALRVRYALTLLAASPAL